MVAHSSSRRIAASEQRILEAADGPDLAVGAKVVCPPHGVGEVVATSVQEIGGVRQVFWRFRILGSGLQLLVPEDKLSRLGLRAVIGAERVPEIWALLRRRRRSQVGTAWTKRFRTFREKLASGSLWLAAESLRDLLLIRRDQELSLTEQRLLDDALRLVSTELAVATGVDPAEVAAELLALVGVP